MMDLSSMLNSDSGAGGASRQQSQPPAPPSKAPSLSTPHTPIQATPPANAFRDYSHSIHASPSAAPAPSPHEYPPTSAAHAHAGHPPPGPSGPYASPTSYHAPPGPFTSRPAPPPLQPPGSVHDPRSPGSASISGPSPYRHTPTSSLSGASGGYFPAPMQNQPPPSPQQRLQYGPPSGYPRDSRDSFASQAGSGPPPVGIPTPHGSVSYMQGQQPIPQTPPIGTPGGGETSYLLLQQQQQQQREQQHHQQQQSHQRSQSLQSISSLTPTSAHAQPPSYGTPYGTQSGSPVATTHQPMQFDHNQQQRQSSQPPTPLAHGPLSTPGPRQSSVNYAQPPSPYQQRISSTPNAYAQAAFHPHTHIQTSPPPPQAASIPRMPSSAPYDAVSESHRRSQSLASHQSRDRSLSVSPKTRIPSLPSSAGQRPPSMHGEPLDFAPPSSHMAPMDRSQREVTPAKRKLEDRDLKPEELEATHRRPPPPEMNGNHANHHSHNVPHHQTQSMPRALTSSPLVARRRKVIHGKTPAWAASGRNVQPKASRNYVISAKVKRILVNGNSHHHHTEGSINSEHVSRHTSPEATRSIKQEEPPPNSTATSIPLARPDGPVMFDGHPFPVDTISFSKPIDYLSKIVADFLFFKVISNTSLAEIRQRNIQFEIEAKLGRIIDRDTNDRLNYPMVGECVIDDSARVAFKSSMSEAQHRLLNDFLNAQVVDSNPANPNKNPNAHVPVNYRRRKELDSFYELPNNMYGRLPHALQQLLGAKHPLKVRVTRDLKSKDQEVIAKIVKARVGDLNIWLPMCPVDCRISVNLEWEWDGPLEEIMSSHISTREKQPDRNKDRLSYSHGFYQVDLTQVTHEATVPGPGPGQVSKSMVKEHELEVELNADVLLDHGRRLMDSKGDSRYAELVDTLVDNVRVMAKKLMEPPMQMQR